MTINDVLKIPSFTTTIYCLHGGKASAWSLQPRRIMRHRGLPSGFTPLAYIFGWRAKAVLHLEFSHSSINFGDEHFRLQILREKKNHLPSRIRHRYFTWARTGMRIELTSMEAPGGGPQRGLSNNRTSVLSRATHKPSASLRTTTKDENLVAMCAAF